MATKPKPRTITRGARILYNPRFPRCMTERARLCREVREGYNAVAYLSRRASDLTRDISNATAATLAPYVAARARLRRAIRVLNAKAA